MRVYSTLSQLYIPPTLILGESGPLYSYDEVNNAFLKNANYEKVGKYFENNIEYTPSPSQSIAAKICADALIHNYFNNDLDLAFVFAKWIFEDTTFKYVIVNAMPRDCGKTTTMNLLLLLKLWRNFESIEHRRFIENGSIPSSLPEFIGEMKSSNFNDINERTCLFKVDDPTFEVSFEEIYGSTKTIASGVNVLSTSKYKKDSYISVKMNNLILININDETNPSKSKRKTTYQTIEDAARAYKNNNEFELAFFNIRHKGDAITIRDVYKKIGEALPSSLGYKELEALVFSSFFEEMRIIHDYLKLALETLSNDPKVHDRLVEKYSLKKLSEELANGNSRSYISIKKELEALANIDSSKGFNYRAYRDLLSDVDFIASIKEKALSSPNLANLIFKKNLGDLPDGGIIPWIYDRNNDLADPILHPRYILSCIFFETILSEFDVKKVVDGVEVKSKRDFYTDNKPSSVIKDSLLDEYGKYHLKNPAAFINEVTFNADGTLNTSNMPLKDGWLD